MPAMFDNKICNYIVCEVSFFLRFVHNPLLGLIIKKIKKKLRLIAPKYYFLNIALNGAVYYIEVSYCGGASERRPLLPFQLSSASLNPG
jgi:hypothetical protein